MTHNNQHPSKDVNTPLQFGKTQFENITCMKYDNLFNKVEDQS